MNIEPLETRIAPAAVFTFTDVDGDDVTIKTSKGTNADLEAIGVLKFSDPGAANPRQLQLIDFTLAPAIFAGTDLTITAKRSAANGGDGFVNVGRINATMLDLGKVTIGGDLGQIDAGDVVTLKSPGIKSLTVQSMGEFGTSTQMGGDLQSDITGAIGSFTVKGNVRDASLIVSAAAPEDATISKLTLGGSLIGGAATDSGNIIATGDIKSVKVGGSIIGGTGDHSALLRSGGNMGKVAIGGSIVGGGTAVLGNRDAGRLSSGGDMGAVKIAGDVLGGVGELSGTIFAGGNLASLTIIGSLIGGDGHHSTVMGQEGQIHSDGDMGKVKIGRDISGGAGNRSAQIYSGAKIGSLTVGGTISGGGGADSGAIHSETTLGSVSITGDILGGAGMRSGRVEALGAVKKFSLTGSLIGGSESNTGHVFGASFDSVKIGGSILGSAEFGAGLFQSLGALKSVAVGGSLIGGSGIDTGLIEAGGDIGKAKILGDIRGGDATGIITLFCSGMVASGGRIGSVFIGGSIVAGLDDSTGLVTNNGAISARDDIGSLAVKGSLVGNEKRTVVISARGQAAPSGSKDIAIGGIKIGGSVIYAQILAGYDNNGTSPFEANSNAQVGSVKVDRDWIASSLVAGVKNRGANNTDDGGFGDDNINYGDGKDQKIAEAADAITSKIASITIKGQALGTIAAGDHFGILAQEIGKVKIGSVSYPLGKGVNNDQLIALGATGDFILDEVPA